MYYLDDTCRKIKWTNMTISIRKFQGSKHERKLEKERCAVYDLYERVAYCRCFHLGHIQVSESTTWVLSKFLF